MAFLALIAPLGERSLRGLFASRIAFSRSLGKFNFTVNLSSSFAELLKVSKRTSGGNGFCSAIQLAVLLVSASLCLKINSSRLVTPSVSLAARGTAVNSCSSLSSFVGVFKMFASSYVTFGTTKPGTPSSAPRFLVTLRLKTLSGSSVVSAVAFVVLAEFGLDGFCSAAVGRLVVFNWLFSVSSVAGLAVN